jgi:NADH-quinone oxidoreductase subunit N
MNSLHFLALLPLLILTGGATLLMLQIAFLRNVSTSAAVATATLLAAALSCIPAAEPAPIAVTPLLQVDPMGLLLSALFCLSGAATVLLSRDYIINHGDEPEEYYLLLVLSTLGACVLALAVHLASLLLGMELLAIALYALIAYPNKSILPLEAAIKYLVLSGAASATILFGFALLYAVTGTLEFAELGRRLGEVQTGDAILMVGSAMIFAGLAFKLSLVPFHLWTPDVYDGAPAPVTGYLASVSKAAVLIAMLRLFMDADLFRYERLIELTGLLAILSMLAGNLLALLQSNVKRMLAYSSIAHVGYLMIVFMACMTSGNRALATEAAVYYLVAYTATTIAAFGLLTLISAHREDRENVDLLHLSGLFWQQPLLAGLMLVALLSLAGIPLTAGFIAKFYIVSAAVDGANWVLLAALVLGSGIGIFYYLRVVFYMSRAPEDHHLDRATARGWYVRAVPGILIAVILLLGTLPQPLMEYLRSIL